MFVLQFCQFAILFPIIDGSISYMNGILLIAVLELFRAIIAGIHQMDGYGWFYKILSKDMNKKEVHNNGECKSDMDRRDD